MKCFAVVVALMVAVPAAADTVSVEARGMSDAGPEDAKVRALDDAFRAAVIQVARDMVDGKELVKKQREVARTVYRRARRFVASYSTLSTKRDSGIIRVHIRAVVKKTELAEALRDVGVMERPVEAGAVEVSSAGPLALVLSEGPGQGQGSLSGGDAGHGGRAFRQAIEAMGVAVTTPRGRSTRTGRLPLDEAAASALAAGSSASAAAVFGYAVTPGPAVRGRQLASCVAELEVFVVLADGRRVMRATERAYGYDVDPARVTAACASRAGEVAAMRVAPAVRKLVPRKSGSTSGTLVRIRGAASGVSVADIERTLANARINVQIVGRRFAAGLVELTLDGNVSAQRLAAVIRSTRLAVGSLVANSRGQVVEVTVRDYAAGGS